METPKKKEIHVFLNLLSGELVIIVDYQTQNFTLILMVYLNLISDQPIAGNRWLKFVQFLINLGKSSFLNEYSIFFKIKPDLDSPKITLQNSLRNFEKYWIFVEKQKCEKIDQICLHRLPAIGWSEIKFEDTKRISVKSWSR